MKAVIKELKRRFFNYASLVAVTSFVFSILLSAGVIDAPMADKWQELVEYGLYALVMAGILNNAGVGKGLRDKKK